MLLFDTHLYIYETMNSFLIVSLVAFLANQHEAKLLPVEPLLSNHLSQTIADIITNFFQDKSNNIVFYRATTSKASFQKQSDIVNDVLWRIGTRQTVFIETPTGIIRPFNINEKRRLNVVFLDTYKSYL